MCVECVLWCVCVCVRACVCVCMQACVIELATHLNPDGESDYS